MLIDRVKKIGICSPSWSGPGEYPYVFEYGIQKLKEIFNMEVIYSSHALKKGFVDYVDRAQDINELFANKDVGFICSSIGGDDSVNLLPFLDLEIIKKNPKPLMGFSDTTTLLLFLRIQCNTPTIYGPSIMSGFSEPSGINEEMVRQIKDLLLTDWKEYTYVDYPFYIEGYNEWSDKDKFPESKPEIKKYQGWQTLNQGKVTGELYGGCLEVIKLLKNTHFFPTDENFWTNKILFLETSEEAPSVDFIIHELKDYHERGILRKIKALLLGQLTYYSDNDKKIINTEIKKLLLDKLHYNNLVVVTDLNFGHVRPQWLLLMGYKVCINTHDKIFKVIQ